MRIDRAEALRRLQSEDNLARLCRAGQSQPEHVTKGRPHRGPQVPEFLRDTLGTLALDPSVKQSDLADEFGVSDSVVSAAKTGRVGGKPANADRASKVAERIEDVKDTALDKLMLSLGLIDGAKLEDLGAKDLSQVASNMGKVFNSLTPKEQNVQQNMQLVFYSPEMKAEDKFKVVET